MTTGRRVAGGSGEDEALSRLYQQVTDLQVARFSADYDFEAGADRFHTWLRQHSPQVTAAVDAIRAGSRPPRQASPAVLSAAAAVPMPGEAVIALGIMGGAAGINDELAAGLADPDPDRGLTALFNEHYPSLVRLAALLVGDIATAEQIVQDSFVALYDAWRRPDSDSALSYLRQAVVTRSRTAMRHRTPAGRNTAESGPGRTNAEQRAMTSRENQAIISALRTLPVRQREAIVLRYYADLSEAQVAAVMRISRGAVKSHTARAAASLRAVIEDWPQ
jgi:RNA polymerase sigma-70 factor (sigma-E family)